MSKVPKTFVKLCDRNCNECPIINHPNSKIVTVILNSLLERFGEDVYKIVQSNCPNLTCCFDCHIDDFCHTEGCKLSKEAEKQAKSLKSDKRKK